MIRSQALSGVRSTVALSRDHLTLSVDYSSSHAWAGPHRVASNPREASPISLSVITAVVVEPSSTDHFLSHDAARPASPAPRPSAGAVPTNASPRVLVLSSIGSASLPLSTVEVF